LLRSVVERRQYVQIRQWKSIQDGSGRHFEFGFYGTIFGRRSTFFYQIRMVMDDAQPKVTYAMCHKPGFRKSNMADGRHHESHQVPTSHL